MRVKVLLGALAIAVATSGSTWAQSAGGKPETPTGVPTVTIINKAPNAPQEAAPPELRLEPAAPERPAPVAAPASPVRAAAPRTPSPSGVRASAFQDDATEAEIDAAADAPSSDANGTVQAESSETGGGAQPAAQAAAPPAAVPEPPPEPTLDIDIDLTRQVMTVSEDGERRFTWPISSARYGYRTPTGTYQPTWMSKMWYSRQYDYAPMPHAIFFHKGVAIHGSYATRALGSPASHGCVRLAPKSAETLYKLVTTHGKDRTRVVVHGTPDHSGARVASRERDPRDGRRASPYRYLPPGYAQRGYQAYGQQPSYYAPPRTRRSYAAPRRYQPRGLYNSYSYGYGF